MNKKKKRITKVTTGVGDDGKTYIVGSKNKVLKSSERIEACGDIDELNSFIGLVRSKMKKEKNQTDLNNLLSEIQNDLFVLGADIASPSNTSSPRIGNDKIEKIESEQNRLLSELESLDDFVVPYGSETVSLLHIVRAIARRAERSVVRLSQVDKINPKSVVFLNRLSDIFFVMARVIAKRNGIKEELVRWTVKKS